MLDFSQHLAEPQLYQERRVREKRITVAASLRECAAAIQVSFEKRRSVQLLRFPIVTFARTAQRAGVPPERVLAIFKRTLTRIRSFQRLQVDEREMARERLVEMVIGGYYQCVIRRRRISRAD